MFAVMGLILAIAPYYIASKILEFTAELVHDLVVLRRKRLAGRPPRDRIRPAVLIFSLLLAVPIGYVLALIIAAAIATYRNASTLDPCGRYSPSSTPKASWI